MKDKKFYLIVCIVAVVIIVIAIILIKNSRNSDLVNSTLPGNLNSGTPVNSTVTPLPVSTSIHGKSVYADPPQQETITIWKKSPFSVYTTVPKGSYVGVANKYDSDKNYIEVFIPQLYDYYLVQKSQVRLV